MNDNEGARLHAEDSHHPEVFAVREFASRASAPQAQIKPASQPGAAPSNTIAFTCGLRRAGEAGPRRAARCNGLLGC